MSSLGSCLAKTNWVQVISESELGMIKFSMSANTGLKLVFRCMAPTKLTLEIKSRASPVMHTAISLRALALLHPLISSVAMNLSFHVLHLEKSTTSSSGALMPLWLSVRSCRPFWPTWSRRVQNWCWSSAKRLVVDSSFLAMLLSQGP